MAHAGSRRHALAGCPNHAWRPSKNLKEPVGAVLADSLLERQWIDAERMVWPVSESNLQRFSSDDYRRAGARRDVDGRTWTTIARPSQPSFELANAPSKLHVAGAYLAWVSAPSGVRIDHLLFILALMILVKGTRRLIATVTAFTIAHTHHPGRRDARFRAYPQQPVEASIALSIVFARDETRSCAARAGRVGRALAMGCRFHFLTCYTASVSQAR